MNDADILYQNSRKPELSGIARATKMLKDEGIFFKMFPNSCGHYRVDDAFDWWPSTGLWKELNGPRVGRMAGSLIEAVRDRRAREEEALRQRPAEPQPEAPAATTAPGMVLSVRQHVLRIRQAIDYLNGETRAALVHYPQLEITLDLRTLRVPGRADRQLVDLKSVRTVVDHSIGVADLLLDTDQKL